MASQNESKAIAPHEPASQASSRESQTAQDYIAGQLQLEADAREALPYVSKIIWFALLIADELEAIRHMHSTVWRITPESFLMSDMQSSTIRSVAPIHTRRRLLLMFNILPWRTRTCRAVSPSQFCLRLRNEAPSAQLAMRTTDES